MVIKDPCGICKKFVATSHNAIKCDICDTWVHIKCNFVPKELYNQFIDENQNPLIKDKSKWVCVNCIKINLPFSHLDDKSFYLNSKGIQNEGELENFNFSLHPTIKETTEKISKVIIETTDPDNCDLNFCNYYETNKFLNSNFDNNSNFSILHFCFSSIPF